MMKLRFRLRLAALAAVALLLPMVACNDHDDPEDGQGVPRVISTTFTGTSLAAVTEDVAAVLSIAIEDRSGASTSFFNAVTFTDYTVDYFGIVPNPPPGVISTGFISVGSTGTLTATVLLAATKAGFSAGQTLPGRFHVSGHDLLGNPVSFESDLAIIFVP